MEEIFSIKREFNYKDQNILALVMFIIFEIVLTRANWNSNINVNRFFVGISFFFLYWNWNKKSCKEFYNYHGKVEMLKNLLMTNDKIEDNQF